MFNSQIQKERSPTNSFVGPTPNFGYVASPVANYSTPAMPRKSRRSFTPLARDMSSPTISPINQPSIKAPAGSASPWNGSLSAIFDNKCSVKVDNAFGKKPISIETPRNLMVERLPSYFSPARNSPQVLSSVYDFKGSNRKPANLSAIKWVICVGLIVLWMSVFGIIFSRTCYRSFSIANANLTNCAFHFAENHRISSPRMEIWIVRWPSTLCSWPRKRHVNFPEWPRR